MSGSTSVIAWTPRPVPAMLPMLNTSPPKTTSAVSNQPAPGTAWFASSWARSPETPTTRQTFSWTAMSTRIETRIANANAAPSWTVNVVVWVMKPGPMALVAMRNMAPRMAVRLLRRAAVSAAVSLTVSAAATASDGGSPVGTGSGFSAMDAPRVRMSRARGSGWYGDGSLIAVLAAPYAIARRSGNGAHQVYLDVRRQFASPHPWTLARHVARPPFVGSGPRRPVGGVS